MKVVLKYDAMEKMPEVLHYEICRFFNNEQVAKLFSQYQRKVILAYMSSPCARKKTKLYVIVWSVCKYRMQVCKLLSSQLLQSLLDVFAHTTQ